MRAIIASMDVRALARYYATDTVARFPILALSAEPVAAAVEIERSVLGYGRGAVKLRCLLEQREGYLYRRDGDTVGFALVGKDGSGPIAALDPADLPDMLLQGRAHAIGLKELEFEVPATQRCRDTPSAAPWLRINQLVTLFISSRPFGQFDRFICFSPPVFL